MLFFFATDYGPTKPYDVIPDDGPSVAIHVGHEIRSLHEGPTKELVLLSDRCYSSGRHNTTGYTTMVRFLFCQVKRPTVYRPWAGCSTTLRISVSRTSVISGLSWCQVAVVTDLATVSPAPTQKFSTLPVLYGVSVLATSSAAPQRPFPGIIGPMRQFSAGQIYQ